LEAALHDVRGRFRFGVLPRMALRKRGSVLVQMTIPAPAALDWLRRNKAKLIFHEYFIDCPIFRAFSSHFV
jgi:hypothetical protein